MGYEYYETDASGNILDASKKLTINDIVWSENESKYYVAVPVFTDFEFIVINSITVAVYNIVFNAAYLSVIQF